MNLKNKKNQSQNTMNIQKVDYANFGTFKITPSNELIAWRGKSFMCKEPTTIEWLQCLSSESWLIDIGANIGIYTIPAALFHVSKVIAIEPEPTNYTELLKNINLNKIESQKVTALPLGISTEYANQPTEIFISKDQAGGSCHQIGSNHDHKLQSISVKRKTKSVYCIALDHLITTANVPHDTPLHIKIDVDGIEADVCDSLFTSGLIHRLSSIQIELNPEIKEHKSLIHKLIISGFIFSTKQVNKARRRSGDFKGFAEYVFIPSFEPETLSNLNLPQSLKNQHTTLYRMYGDNSIELKDEHLFNLDKISNHQAQLSEFSRIPSSAIIKSIFNIQELIRAKENILCCLKTQQNSFKFSSSNDFTQQDSLRIRIDHSQLKAIDSKYIDYISKRFSSIDLARSLFNYSKILSNVTDKNQQPLNHKYFNGNYLLIARIRHFVDLKGYYLSKHNDALDTIFAMIVPLIPYSTSTSILSPSPSAELPKTPSYINIKDLQNSFQQELTSSMQNEEIYYDNKKGTNAKVVCKTHRIPVKPGEAAMIFNQCSFIYNLHASHADIHRIATGHGVFPPIEDFVRPVLLVDYLIKNKTYQDRLQSYEQVICNSKLLLDSTND